MDAGEAGVRVPLGDPQMSELIAQLTLHTSCLTRLVRQAEAQDMDWVKEFAAVLPTMGNREARDLGAVCETIAKECREFRGEKPI